MKYQLVTWQQNGSVRDNGDGTSTLAIMVTSGIVGDTYGFVKNDATTFSFANTQTADQAKATGTASATAFVSKKYPNTP